MTINIHLGTLDLEGTNVFDINPLASKNNINYLDLGSTRISDISPLADLTNLKMLDLFYTNLSDEKLNWLMRRLPYCDMRF